MLRHLDKLEVRIIRLGVFVVFVVTFGEYVVKKVWPVLKPLFQVSARAAALNDH